MKYERSKKNIDDLIHAINNKNHKQVYITNSKNIIQSSVKIENNILEKLEVVNHSSAKFFPCKWYHILYSALPEELILTDTSERLALLVINFRKKIYDHTLIKSVVNMEEINKEWQTWITDFDTTHIPFPDNRYKYSLKLTKKNYGWTFCYSKEIGISIEQFVEKFVYTNPFGAFNLKLYLKENHINILPSKHIIKEKFYVDGKKIKMLNTLRNLMMSVPEKSANKEFLFKTNDDLKFEYKYKHKLLRLEGIMFFVKELI